jgi:hypothetical protein
MNPDIVPWAEAAREAGTDAHPSVSKAASSSAERKGSCPSGSSSARDSRVRWDVTQGKVDPGAAARTLRDYMSSSKGQRKIAATMALPLRQMMDYVGRKTFLVEEMHEPCGACKRTDYDDGHKAGCQECSVRSVLTT